MAELKPSSIVVGLLLFTIVIVGFFYFVADLSSTYGVADTTAFRTTFDKSSELLDISNNTAKEISEAGTPQNSYQSLFSLGGWKALVKVLKTIPTIVESILRGFADLFGVPEAIVVLIMAIVIVSIAAALIGAVFGRSV